MEFVSLQIGHSYANQQKKMEFEQAKNICEIYNLLFAPNTK